MRKALIALAVGGALAAGPLPALAQSYDAGITQREDNIRERIAEGVRDGDLNYGQAARLRSELRTIVDLDQRYETDGMTDWQARDLNSRLSLLSSRVNYDVTISRGDRGD
jgi:IS30 family transposase